MKSCVPIEGKKGFKYENWAKSYGCEPELYFEPQDLRELRQIVARARVERRTVKVIGYGHSPSEIACTDGFMVSLKRFNKVLHIDEEKKIFKAEAGILFSELVDILYSSNLALSVLCTISNLSLGGAIATGTHGSGLQYGSLSTYILELEMLCADGTILTLSRDRDEDVFLAACLNLGALGIVTSVTMRCETAYKLSCVQYPLSFKDFCENYKVHASSSDHFRCFVFPHTDQCQLQHISRTDKPILSRKTSWFWDRLIGVHVLEFLFWISSFLSFVIPWVNRMYFKFLFGGRCEIVDRYDKILSVECAIPFYVMEWAVPIENTAVVLFEMNAWIENNFCTHFPIEVRFSKADDILISPAYNSNCCYLNIVMHRPYYKTIEHDKLWTAVRRIVMKYGGRSHWAKDHNLTKDELRDMYPMWSKFAEIRNHLDANRMFINEYLARIF